MTIFYTTIQKYKNYLLLIINNWVRYIKAFFKEVVQEIQSLNNLNNLNTTSNYLPIYKH